jgi:prepilin-type N-terminal cleavage/methylation domain-containing protein
MKMTTTTTIAGRVAVRPRGMAAGFTLIEVMISLLLVLLLVYGVAQVFKMSGDTVGANQAVASMVRDQRAAIATMKEDFRNSLVDSPLFMISSQLAYQGPASGAGQAPQETYDATKTIRRGFRAGFRSPEEEAQSLDTDRDPTMATVDTATGTTVVQRVPFTAQTDRTPRLDRMSFFARNLYQRQTASNRQAMSTVSSQDAYIWYGHTALPGHVEYRSPSPTFAADYVIPHNQYARDRILGRMAILLKTSPYAITNPPEEPIVGKPLNEDPLSPLGVRSRAWESLSDLADTTIDIWRQQSDALFAAQPNAWYVPMEDDLSGPAREHRMWWANCNPILARPVTQQKLAQTTAAFVPQCTQFIVEYAGDFLDQDEAHATEPGKIVDAKAKFRTDNGVVETDTPANATLDRGAIDYIIDRSADTSNPPTRRDRWVKKIRWYGLPRDVNGDGLIGINDVLPLADVMAYAGNPPGGTAVPGLQGRIGPWEQKFPTPGFMSSEVNGNYSNLSSNLAAARNFKYVCAWHNGGPAMVRITMKLDDPTGRLQGGQWYEFVLTR